MRPTKSQGQLDYEADLAAHPNYHTGEPRKTWGQLGAVEQWSWERRPAREEYTQRDKLREQMQNGEEP